MSSYHDDPAADRTYRVARATDSWCSPTITALLQESTESRCVLHPDDRRHHLFATTNAKGFQDRGIIKVSKAAKGRLEQC
jgi:hypothetical protein